MNELSVGIRLRCRVRLPTENKMQRDSEYQNHEGHSHPINRVLKNLPVYDTWHLCALVRPTLLNDTRDGTNGDETYRDHEHDRNPVGRVPANDCRIFHVWDAPKLNSMVLKYRNVVKGFVERFVEKCYFFFFSESFST